MLKAYHITYDGLWLGGRAIVIAHTRKIALRLLEEEGPVEFTDVKIEKVISLDKPKVIYNYDGDY